MHVDLVYFAGCPHAPAARQHLREAFTSLGLKPAWSEWDTLDARTPPPYQHYGSPTVLVNGSDVAGGKAVTGSSCVVGGAPSVAAIASALRAAQ